MEFRPALRTLRANTILTLLALGIASLAGAAPVNPLASQARYAGTWEGEGLRIQVQSDGVSLDLRISSGGGEYEGAASIRGAGFDGKFSAAGAEFPLSGQLVNDTLHFETGGTTYTLRRPAPPAASANPLADRPAAQPPAPRDQTSTYGQYRLNLPSGWSTTLDSSGSVGLVPPGVTEGGSEVYALTRVEGIADPASPAAAQTVQQLLGDAQSMAQYHPATSIVEGREVVEHTYAIPQAGVQVTAYMAKAGDHILALIASGETQRIAPRNAMLRQIMGSAEYLGAAPNASQPTPTAPQPPAQRASQVQTAPNAPAFEPGVVSDGKPASEQWVQHLSGKLLTKMDSYSSGSSGGYSSKDRAYLHPTGQFEYSGYSLVTVSVPGANANDGGTNTSRGWWRVLTVNNMTYLGFVVEGNPQEMYAQLTMQEGATYMDGGRVYVTYPQP